MSLSWAHSLQEGRNYPGVGKPAFHKHYNTIGEFYQHILHALTFLAKNGTNRTIFSGDVSKQLWFDFPFGSRGKLIKVTDLTSARQAIEEIIREGEGCSPCNPFDWKNDNGDLSHYFLFKSIVEAHEIHVSSKDGKDDVEVRFIVGSVRGTLYFQPCNSRFVESY